MGLFQGRCDKDGDQEAEEAQLCEQEVCSRPPFHGQRGHRLHPGRGTQPPSKGSI